MDALNRSIRDALESGGPISRKRVRGWIHQAANVQADALLYKLTREAWSRIKPHLETAETCALIERYLFGMHSRESSRRRRVNPTEAAVVKRIFALYDEGEGLKGIAMRLVAEGAPAPKPFAYKTPSRHASRLAGRHRPCARFSTANCI